MTKPATNTPPNRAQPQLLEKFEQLNLITEGKT